MVRDGKGGRATSVSGKAFESLYDVSKILNYPNGDIKASNRRIYNNDKAVGYYGVQREFYDLLVSEYKNKLFQIGIRDTTSFKRSLLKVLIPDGFCLIKKQGQDVLILFELKSQYVSGSVDEKLQSGGYKKIAFQKLVKNLGVKVEYAYITNFWYCQRQFIGIKSWLSSQQIPVFCDHENFADWPELNKPQIDPNDKLWWSKIYPAINEQCHLSKTITRSLMFERLQKFVKDQIIQIKSASLASLKLKSNISSLKINGWFEMATAFNDFCTEKILNCNKHLLKSSEYIQKKPDSENFQNVQNYLQKKLSIRQ